MSRFPANVLSLGKAEHASRDSTVTGKRGKGRVAASPAGHETVLNTTRAQSFRLALRRFTHHLRNSLTTQNKVVHEKFKKETSYLSNRCRYRSYSIFSPDHRRPHWIPPSNHLSIFPCNLSIQHKRQRTLCSMEMWSARTGWQDDLICCGASHQLQSHHFIYDAKWLLREADCGGGLFVSYIILLW